MRFRPCVTPRTPLCYPRIPQSEYVASDLFATDSLRSLYEASATGALDEEASVRGHRLTGKDVRIARRLSKL